MNRSLFIASLALFAAASCSPAASTQDDPRQELLRSWWYDFLGPNLDRLIEANVALDAASRAYCADPSEANLDVARQAWTLSQLRLKHVEVFAFGPYTEEPERYRAELDFWPARPETIEMIAGGEGSLDASAVAGFGGAGKGLPAAEYLLWTTPLASDSARRCEYLVGIAGASTEAARGLHLAWNPDEGGYYGQLLRPGDDSEFGTIVLAVSAVINRIWFGIENIRMERLGKPLGTTSGGSPQPELAEARFSQQSILSIQETLVGIEALYLGEEDAVGLSRFVAQSDEELDARIRAEFVASHEALAAIPDTLGEAVVADPEAVQHAIDVLGRLQTLVEVDLISTLGLSRSFNDTDGD